MTVTSSRVLLPGSRRDVLPGSTIIGPADPQERVDFTVKLRRKTPLPTLVGRPTTTITRQQLDETYGAAANDVAKTISVLQRLGLQIVSQNPGARSIKAAGPVNVVEAAFGTRLLHYTHESDRYRAHSGPLNIPVELDGIVVGVFGLDTRRAVNRRRSTLRLADADSTAAANRPWFFPSELAQAYNYPASDGAGQSIGILEFGGGYFPNDLTAFRQAANISGTPNVIPISVDNTPTNARDGDEGEVMLDIEVVTGLCPAATVPVYFAPFTEQGWIDVLDTAVHDQQNKPSVLSVSWGIAEDAPGGLSAAALSQINEALQAAALVGVTVCVASGDDGSDDQVGDGRAHVNFPASSPYVLAVGGTSLHLGSGGNTEVAWKDGDGLRKDGGGSTGGGVSVIFPRPSWQTISVESINPGSIAGRCMPDVCADASAETGYFVVVDGKRQISGGTSAATPLWAGLLGRVNALIGGGKTVGYLSPVLYGPSSAGATTTLGSAVCTDIVQGNNNTAAVGGYSATVGYDAVTGWGSPQGANLLTALQPVVTSVSPAVSDVDPFAVEIIDHNSLEEDIAQRDIVSPDSSISRHTFNPINWPSGTAPTVVAVDTSPSEDDPLPSCDVVLITYTTDEANAMASILTPGYLAVPPSSNHISKRWNSYAHNFDQYVSQLRPGSSPALSSHNLGLYQLITIGGKRVICFKSSLHLARDGKSMPITQLVKQIASETKASLIISTGTAGAIGAPILLGDANIATSVRFDCRGVFASAPFNNETFTSNFVLKNSSFLDIANQKLVPSNASFLPSAQRLPQIMTGAIVQGEKNVVVTTDIFAFDDAGDSFHLEGEGCMVEMDDAAIALACAQMGSSAPTWLAIRNASDPQMPAGASKGDASKIYEKYGFFTTIQSVLGCWAAILGS